MKQSLSSNREKIFLFRNNLSAFHITNKMVKLLVYALIGVACFGVLLALLPDLPTAAYRRAIAAGQRKFFEDVC